MHHRHPLTELPLISPPQAPDAVYSDAEAAVADLKARYAAATGFLRERFAALMKGKRAGGALPGVLSAGQRDDLELRQGQLAAVVRARHRARALRDDDHPAGALRRLPDPAARAADPEPRHAGPGRHLGHADPAALRDGARTRMSRARSSTRCTGRLRDLFDVPDLNTTDDHIVNGTPAARCRRARGRWRRSPRSASTTRSPGSRTTRRRARRTSRTTCSSPTTSSTWTSSSSTRSARSPTRARATPR